MNIRLTLHHKNEKRITNIEVFGFPANTAAIIMQNAVSKANRIHDLDRAVLDYCKSRIPQGYEQWAIAGWEFVDASGKRGQSRQGARIAGIGTDQARAA